MRRRWRESQDLPVDYPVVLRLHCTVVFRLHYPVVFRLDPLRHKAMAEQPSLPFRQSPTLVDRPQRRQFLFRETGAHADLGIVAADVVAADESQQCRCTKREVKDRKSTRLNSSHRCISYAVFCLKKKKTT